MVLCRVQRWCPLAGEADGESTGMAGTHQERKRGKKPYVKRKKRHPLALARQKAGLHKDGAHQSPSPEYPEEPQWMSVQMTALQAGTLRQGAAPTHVQVPVDWLLLCWGQGWTRLTVRAL